MVFTLKVLGRSRIARYSCKFSRKTYSQPQHLAVLVLKTMLKQDYRGVCDLLLEMKGMATLLRLKKVPHFTTLQKFLQRFNPLLLEKIISEVLDKFQNLTVAVDASGFTSSYASSYYVKRINLETTSKHFLKSSIAIDTKSQLILCCKLRKSPSNDSRDFIPLMKKTRKLVKISKVLADKGYDGEKNHQFIIRELKAVPFIPVKGGKSKPTRSKLRKRMLRRWKSNPTVETAYHQRSRVETVFSVIKRKFGEPLVSRTLNQRKKELKIKHLVYNLYRRCIFIYCFPEVFYRAHGFREKAGSFPRGYFFFGSGEAKGVSSFAARARVFFTCSSLLVPVQIILPFLKRRREALGSRNLRIAPGNCSGSYSTSLTL